MIKENIFKYFATTDQGGGIFLSAKLDARKPSFLKHKIIFKEKT